MGASQRFRIRETLGEGARGRVLLAEDREHGDRLVALKVAKIETGAEGELGEQYRLLTGLRHPHLAEVLDLTRDEALGGPVLVIEYVKARDALGALAGKPWTEILETAAPALLGLDFLHDRGLLHGDVKPANLLIDDTGRARWVDYGFARALGSHRGAMQGTLEYMAPELLTSGRVDGRADLYSFGALLYHVLVGRPPFSGPDAAALIRAQVEEAPVIPRSAGLTPAVAGLLRDLLAKDPGARPATGAEILDRLGGLGELALETTVAGLDRIYATSAPLIARGAQLRLVDGALSALGAPESDDGSARPPMVVLAGGAGSGRTRLLREARTMARSRGLDWIELPTPRAGDPPLRSAARLVETLIPRVPAREAERLRARLGGLLDGEPDPEAPGQEHPGERPEAAMAASRLREAVAEMAELAAAQRGLVVAIDGVDRADEPSRAALLRAARRMNRARGLLLVTAKPGSVSMSGALTVPLVDLGADEVRMLLSGLFGGATIDAGLAGVVHGLCGGNPALVVETARDWIDSGWARRAADGWAVPSRRELPPEAPATVAALLERRLEHLSPAERELLAAVTTLGAPSSISLLAAACGWPHERVRDRLADLTDRGLVRRHGSGPAALFEMSRTELEAPLTRELTPKATKTLHRKAAEHLEGLAASPDPTGKADAARIARHWDSASEPLRAVPFHREAGSRATRLHDYGTATAHLRDAVEAAGDHAGADLLGELGGVLFLSGDYASSRRAFERARDAVDRDSLAGLSAEAGVARAAVLANDADGGDLCEALIPRVKASDDRVLHAELLKSLGVHHGMGHRMAEALACFRAGLVLLGDDGPPTLRGLLLHDAAIALANLGQAGEATELAKEALDIAELHELPYLTCRTLAGLGFIQREMLQYETAAEMSRRAAMEHERIGDLRTASAQLLAAADEERLCGQLGRALEYAHSAADISEEADAQDRLAISRSDLGFFMAQLGSFEHAEGLTREAVALRGGRSTCGPMLLNNLAESLFGQRKVQESREIAQEAISRAQELQQPRPEAFGRRALASAVREEGSPADAVALCRSLLDSFEDRPESAAWSELRILAHTEHARGLLALGDTIGATSAARAALDIALRKKLVCYQWTAHAVLARVLDQAGDVDASAIHWRRAAGGVRGIAAGLDDDAIRRAFLAMPEASAALRHGEDAPRGARPGADSRLAGLYDVIRSINSIHEVQPLLERILAMTLDTVEAERGLILLADEEGSLEVGVQRGVEADTAQDATDISRSIIRAASKGKSVFSLDALHDERFGEAPSVRIHEIRSLMCVPLRMHERVVGTVYVDNRRPGRLFKRDDLRFLEAFADQAAVAIENARNHERLLRENEALRRATSAERPGYGRIIGGSHAMQEVYRTIERAAKSSLPVFVTGESGTGKELVARSLHEESDRSDGPFQSQNCSAIPESLLESVLFGHKRGAFTGADKDQPGLFRMAHQGTLFLDEIGDMPLAMQAKLLRVLQDGMVRPVGGGAEIQVDVRIVSATNRDLGELRDEGKFRDDLFFRIHVLRVALPPLRERKEDIPDLVSHFLSLAAADRGIDRLAVDDTILQLLVRHDWPGNIRELQSAVARLALVADGAIIRTRDLEADPELYETLTRLEGPPTQHLESVERREIERALKQSGGNREKAARLLGISRATIFRRIRRYGLGGPRKKAATRRPAHPRRGRRDRERD